MSPLRAGKPSRFQNLPRAVSGPLECPLQVCPLHHLTREKMNWMNREWTSYTHPRSIKGLRSPVKNVGFSAYMVFFRRISRVRKTRCDARMSSIAVGRMTWRRIRSWRVWRCRVRFCIIRCVVLLFCTDIRLVDRGWWVIATARAFQGNVQCYLYAYWRGCDSELLAHIPYLNYSI